MTKTRVIAALVMAPVPLPDWLIILPIALCIGAGAVLMMMRHAIRYHAPVAIAASQSFRRYDLDVSPSGTSKDGSLWSPKVKVT